MRALALILLAALPATAQDVLYDDTILPACLDRVAGDVGQERPLAPALRACIGASSDACMNTPDGQTTAGMSACLHHEMLEWDMLMTAWYDKSLRQAREADDQVKQLGSAADPAAPVLERAQQAWTGFRDSACLFQEVRWQGGTAGGPASAECLLQLTAEQALRLRDISEGW